MDHDEALANLIEAKTKCSDACVDETVHAPHRAEVEQAYATFAAASKQRASLAPFQPDEPVGTVTVTEA